MKLIGPIVMLALLAMFSACGDKKDSAARDQEVQKVLQEGMQKEKGMNAADAYALASLSVDLGIGEAVDIVNLVYAKIPKHVFKSKPDFWYPLKDG